MSTGGSPPEEQPPSEASSADPEGPSCSQQGLAAAATAETAKKRRRKKHHHKVYVPGNSKALRRIKRLGYTPEHNKRGYRVRTPREIPKPVDEEDDCGSGGGIPAVQITAEYPYESRSQGRRHVGDDRNAPKRRVFYSYTKVNGKSSRYLNETPEEQAARRAKYKERNRKYTEKETEEQHRQRLERRRLRRIADRQAAGKAVVGRRRRRSAQEIEADRLLKDIRVISVGGGGGDEEGHLETLQREYAEFNRYMAEKLQESVETKNRELEIAYWQHDPEQVNPPAENPRNAAATSYSPQVGTNGYHGAVQKPPNTVLYSNEPVDPEIALLETSDDTFVPVQVIIQTCDDFDDMLEIEENP